MNLTYRLRRRFLLEAMEGRVNPAPLSIQLLQDQAETWIVRVDGSEFSDYVTARNINGIFTVHAENATTSIDRTYDTNALKIRQVVFFGNDGDDYFQAGLTLSAINGSTSFEAHGGAGNDVLIVPGAYPVSGFSMYGDAGSDTILVGENGLGFITAGPEDAVYGSWRAGRVEITGSPTVSTTPDFIVRTVGNQLLILASDLPDNVSLRSVSPVFALHAQNSRTTLDLNIPFAGLSNVRFYGQDGDDLYLVQGGPTTFAAHGGFGNDILSFTLGFNENLFFSTTNASGDQGNDVVSVNGAVNGTLHGNAGNDTVIASYRTQVIYGDEGEDTIYGTGTAMVPVGTGWKMDTRGAEVHGGAGNDVIRSTNGNLYADDGDDVVVILNSPDSNFVAPTYVYGGNGFDTMVSQTAYGVHFYGDGGNDLLYGGNTAPNWMYGGDGNDRIVGGAGANEIDGQAGDDTIYAGAGPTVAHGSDGNDIMYGGDNTNTTLYGDNGQDIMIAGNSPIYIYGGAGNDYLYGGPTLDMLSGGPGDDYIDGKAWHDEIYGGDGHDYILAGAGDDNVNGNAGDDFIDGGPGNDVLSGDEGQDTVRGGLGDDTIDGGIGSDYLYGDAGNDVIHGGEGYDAIYGGAGNDRLFGDDLTDWLYGEAGDDYLVGGAGDDLLNGGAGTNILIQDFPTAAARVQRAVKVTAVPTTKKPVVKTVKTPAKTVLVKKMPALPAKVSVILKK